MKMVITIIKYGVEKAAMPLLRVEKPPVESVEKECQTASKTGIPPAASKIISESVRKKYIATRRFAASLILGWILSVGPENSVAAIWIFDDFKAGKTESEINIIPIPPSHWVMLLQNRIPCGIDSILGSIVAPVVVKPDIDSKKASPKPGIEPLIRNGNVPKMLKIIQIPVTII